MADFICGQLLICGRSTVRCERSEVPEAPLRKTEHVRVQVSSVRLDATVAHLFHLSQEDAALLARQGRIHVDDAEETRPDARMTPGQVLSVRGHGRARFAGEEGKTKKGKLILAFDVYR